MRIIIVGCGKVGSTITEQLVKEGHDVAVIDRDSDVIQDITNNFDVMGVVGNGASYSIQKEAGIEDAHLLIAVTGSDEQNLLCCLFAKKQVIVIRSRESVIRFIIMRSGLSRKNSDFP